MPYKDKEKQRAWEKAKRIANKEYYLSLKSHPCTDCGIRYPHYMMEFDHCRGTKKAKVSQFYKGGPKSKSFIDELAKCDLVCANCHSARTYFRTIPE